MRIRIVVADQAEACFYDIAGAEDALQPVGRLTDPEAHLHNRDLTSDRPGRVFDHSPMAAGRRGATAHHGVGGERSPRKHEAELFARHIAADLEKAQATQQFDRLVIMAAPAFLGLLRAALPHSVRSRVAAEVPKDLAHQPPTAVREHLPMQIFHVALPGD
ncbi:MAG TPA: host attachment protein [Steroidobacteraceae bacterium]|nr:host attachment protein [Steroidobacteraceae bacterium]